VGAGASPSCLKRSYWSRGPASNFATEPIQAYAAELEKRIRPHLRTSNGSWRVDETYVRVKGRWTYLYRAVDSRGQTIDFLLSARRDAAAAKRFFRKALAQPHTVNPRTVTVDKNPAYPRAAAAVAVRRARGALRLRAASASWRLRIALVGKVDGGRRRHRGVNPLHRPPLRQLAHALQNSCFPGQHVPARTPGATPGGIMTIAAARGPPRGVDSPETRLLCSRRHHCSRALKVIIELGVSEFDELGQRPAGEIAVLVVDRLDPCHPPPAVPAEQVQLTAQQHDLAEDRAEGVAVYRAGNGRASDVAQHDHLDAAVDVDRSLHCEDRGYCALTGGFAVRPWLSTGHAAGRRRAARTPCPGAVWVWRRG
jgi:DDE domain